jgi:hypothetical protein
VSDRKVAAVGCELEAVATGAFFCRERSVIANDGIVRKTLRLAEPEVNIR